LVTALWGPVPARTMAVRAGGENRSQERSTRRTVEARNVNAFGLRQQGIPHPVVTTTPRSPIASADLIDRWAEERARYRR